MGRNSSLEHFRATATEEQWLEIVTEHESLSKEEFEEKYHFSWNSIMSEALARGYYKRKRKSPSAPTLAPESPIGFYVSPVPAGQKKISRSVQLYDDIYTRLQLLENENSQYTHTSILNQLLDESLKNHGY